MAWFHEMERQQQQLFEDKVAALAGRVERAKATLEGDDLEAFFAMERARVTKMRTRLQAGLDKALTDLTEREVVAIADLRDGLQRAVKDMNDGMSVAKSDESKPDGALLAVRDLEKGLNRAIVDLFRGVRASRYHYRQGIYIARKDLREADEDAVRELEL